MRSSKEVFLQKTWVVWLVALVCCLLWGSAVPCIKIGNQLFSISSDDSGSLLLFAGLRFLIAGVIAILIGSLAAKKFLYPKRSALPKISLLSLTQTVIQYIFFYIGVAHTTGVKSSVIVAANTFFAILISSLLFKQEKLTAKKLIGCAVGFSGVLLINLSGGQVDMNLRLDGEGFVLISTVSYAFSSVLVKRFSQTEDPFMLSGYQFLMGGGLLVLIGLLSGGSIAPTAPTAWLMLVYLGFLSAVAYSLWGILLKHNPVSRITIFGFMNPVIGVILSALLLGEGQQAFSWISLAALVLACAGIIIVNKKGSEPH